jgi:hypothetical protein
MTREHYISHALLDSIAGHGHAMELRGFPWQGDIHQPIATAGMTAWVLCDRHNNGLSDLDTEANRLIQIMDQIYSNDGREEEFNLDGLRLERWLLKTLSGCIASGNMLNQRNERLPKWRPPLQWLEILFHGQQMPDGCGLYLPNKNPGKGVEVTRSLLKLAPVFASDCTTLLGMGIWLFGIEFLLGMDRTVGDTPDRLLDGATYRPAGILFHCPGCQKRLLFDWGNHQPDTDFEIRLIL